MKNAGSKLFRAGDLIICFAVVAMAVLLFVLPFTKSGSSVLAVSVGGSTQRYELGQDREFVLENNGIMLNVKIEAGEASVVLSTCPDKVCVRTGKISEKGQIIVCAPADIAIWIESGEEDGYDGVIG